MGSLCVRKHDVIRNDMVGFCNLDARRSSALRESPPPPSGWVKGGHANSLTPCSPGRVQRGSSVLRKSSSVASVHSVEEMLALDCTSVQWYWRERPYGYHTRLKWCRFPDGMEETIEERVNFDTMNLCSTALHQGRAVQKLHITRLPCWAIWCEGGARPRPLSFMDTEYIEKEYLTAMETRAVLALRGETYLVDFSAMEVKQAGSPELLALRRQDVTLQVATRTSRQNAAGPALQLCDTLGAPLLVLDNAGVPLPAPAVEETSCVLDCTEHILTPIEDCPDGVDCTERSLLHTKQYTHPCPMGERCLFYLICNKTLEVSNRCLTHRAKEHCAVMSHVKMAHAPQTAKGSQESVHFRGRWETGADIMVYKVEANSAEWNAIATEAAALPTGSKDNTTYYYSFGYLERIQNKSVWAVYLHMRQCVAARNGGSHNERVMYTPVSRDDVAMILRHGFTSERKSVAQSIGRGVTPIGNGRHFYGTLDAARASVLDVSAPDSVYVLHCLVSVGMPGVSTTEYALCPPADGAGFFDCSSAFAEDVVVLHEAHMAYPMYIFTFYKSTY